jgi:PKD repeat protein
LIGAFPGGAEVDCLAFATFVPSDIPWIDELPKTGTVPASGNQNVTINYDTTGMASGDYLATLSFSTDTPYGALNVPVTLHVLEPVAATASADHTSGTAPMAVNFSCTASGGIPPYTFDWDFGDATAHSTAQNPSHTYYMGGNFNVVLTVTDSTGHHASDSMTMNVTAPNVEIMTFFLDDFGSCQVCLNRLTGHYQWNVLSGPNAGSYSGTAQVYNNGGIFYSMPGDSNMIYVYYDRVNHKAWGYLYQTGAAYYCQLSDSDTTDDPQVCQTVVTP